MTKRKRKNKSTPSTFYYKPKKYHSTEDTRWYRRLIITLSLIALIFIIFWFWGISIIANLDRIWSTFRNIEEDPGITDTLPPLPPRLNSIPQAINKPTIEISGFSEPGSMVTFFINDELFEKVLADKNGAFSFEDISLRKGKNHLYTTATDSAGNESHPSKIHLITYDEKAPEIHIEEPEDGQIFQGKNERTIKIIGTVSKNASLTINETRAIVDSDGEFSFYINLEENDNTIKFEAKDEAGNVTEEEITVIYIPNEDDEETNED